MTDSTPTDDELEAKYSDEPQYTVTLNGTVYRLTEEARQTIQERARHEYDENELFSCWWKVASPDQYSDEEWEESVHEPGDPILVIETRGPMVPWEDLDELNPEMQEADAFGGLGGDDQQPDEIDEGNGMKTLDPNSEESDTEKIIGRTHFEQSPMSFEGVQSPDGEEEEKIPPAPDEMPDNPVMVKWVPEHPEVEHTWEAGEALVETTSWVEWNIQARADQPRPYSDDADTHTPWESLLIANGCEAIDETESTESERVDSSAESDDIGGKYGGNNWQV